MLFKKKDKRDRVLIKKQIAYLTPLIGNGAEFLYRDGCIGSGEGWKYWRNFGDWKKKVRQYKYVILGENYYNPDAARYIKQFNPKCKVILFYWNKIVNEDYKKLLDEPNLDAIYTFEEDDAEEYNIKLNTTFYTKRLQLPENKIENDVVFLGRAKDRMNEILDLEKTLKKNKVKTDFHIVTSEKDYVDYKDYLVMVSKAKCILDFNAYNQRGLALRTMESLFHKKKLITTNKHIKDHPFYNKNNIFIIGEDNIKDIKKFINSPYEEIDQEIIDYYDFDNWIQRFE